MTCAGLACVSLSRVTRILQAQGDGAGKAKDCGACARYVSAALPSWPPQSWAVAPVPTGLRAREGRRAAPRAARRESSLGLARWRMRFLERQLALLDGRPGLEPGSDGLRVAKSG